MEPGLLYTTLHLLGVVIGFGGALMSDAMFLTSLKDKKITKTEVRFLHLGSTFVWGGLLLIVISGALLFLQDPVMYMQSAKFLSKMTVIVVIIVNGAMIHSELYQVIVDNVGKRIKASSTFMKKSNLLLTSGAVSIVSWFSAFLLGMWRGIPYSYSQIIVAYVALILIAIGIGLVLKQQFFAKK